MFDRPYIGEHSARLTNPDQYDEFRRENDKFGIGIHAIWGIKLKPKRTAELQAIRFDAKKFTVAKAKQWLKDHDYKPILFEPAKEEKTIKTEMLYRTVEIKNDEVNRDDRIIDVSFSSEEPIERFFGIEILDHEKESVRLNRLNKGGSLLVQHNTDDIVGVIEKAYISSDRMGRARVRFGKSTRAEEVFQDVIDRIRTNISVGYQIHQMTLAEKKDDKSVYRVNDWEPLEISLVSIPADISVGIGREKQEFEILVVEEVKSMQDGILASKEMQEKPHINIEEVKSEVRKAEMQRVKEIIAIGKKHGCSELAEKAVQEGRALDEFRQEVLESVYKAKPATIIDPNIGMSEREIRQYSIVRAIRQITEKGVLDGLEKEASDATTTVCKRTPKGFFIPQDIVGGMKRALSAGDVTKGGYLVGTDVLVADMIELLRNKPLVAQMGAKTLSGLVGNVAIPRVTGGATAYWLSETGEATGSDQTFGQLGLTPKRLVGDTVYSKELVMQTSLDVEAFVRNDLMTVLAIAKDLAAINGAGGAEPVGIMNTTGIKTVTFGGAATWAKVVEFETALSDANADAGTMAYLATPAVSGKWKTIPKVANQAIFLWEKGAGLGIGEVNGYPARTTKQVPADKVIFANWADLILAEWAGIDVVVDPYSLKKTGQIEVTITLHSDIGVRHPVSFCVSTDSGAQ